MELKAVKATLEDASKLFEAAGDLAVSQGFQCVADLLSASRESTIEEFVSETTASLLRADQTAKSTERFAEDIARRLRGLGEDIVGFERVFKELKSQEVSKEAVQRVAKLYAGVVGSSVQSKPKALKVIEEKFRASAFEASRGRVNEGVTPW